MHPGEEVGYIVAGPGSPPHRHAHNALDLSPDTGTMLSTVGKPLAEFTG